MYRAKKLVAVSATSILVTVSLEAITLQRVHCISYLVQFYGEEVKVLIDSGNEFNAMTPAYILKLGLQVHLTNVKA